MDVLLLELVLWGGLLFFFWALKDGLGRVESDIEKLGLLNKRRQQGCRARSGFDRPDSLTERIGSYRDAAIYRYAMFDGQRYEFERTCLEEHRASLEQEERYVEPGLVYVPSRRATLPSLVV